MTLLAPLAMNAVVHDGRRDHQPQRQDQDQNADEPILASDAGMKGPGGESVFADASGALWMAFDAWVPGAVGYPNSRSLYLRHLSTSGAVPTVAPAG